jgi:hypothetical protein
MSVGTTLDLPQPRPPLRAARESLTDGAPQRYECRGADCLIIHASSAGNQHRALPPLYMRLYSTLSVRPWPQGLRDNKKHRNPKPGEQQNDYEPTKLSGTT